MNAVDTNVLVYALDDREPIKQAKARTLLRRLRQGPVATVLLWQVAGEYMNQLRSWADRGRLNRASGRRALAVHRRFFPLTLPTLIVLDRALDLTDRFSLSHWDSMLLAACIEAGVDTLFTEDMGAPIRYDSVQLVNPFI